MSDKKTLIKDGVATTLNEEFGETPEEKAGYVESCGHTPAAMHGCPYKEDINGDYTSKCNCCEACEHECAMDI